MKKIFCILLAVMLLSLFTACGCSTDANVEGEAGNNSRMYDDSTYDGDNNRTNDGSSMQGGASAEFDIYGGDSTAPSSNGSRRTSSFEKGELSQLASLIGANDFTVIEKLGEGDPFTVIQGNTAFVRRRTYKMPVFETECSVILSYGDDGLIENIELSPPYMPVIWTMNISNEFGAADKISTDGLDYKYYSVWRSDDIKIELSCWNEKMSVQLSKA